MAELPVVEVRRISKHFGEGPARVDALREVSLDVFPGTVIGLRGPSGSGKSTLLNVVGCILEPNSGTMRLNGELVYDGKWLRADLRGLRLEKIGFIFQSHNLLPFLNAWENIAVARILAGAGAAQAKGRALELLTYLGIERRQDAMPGELSGGEAQRVAIARALANDPRIILADEPTAALDSPRAAAVMDLLRKVATERRTAVIVVTHDEKIFDRFDHIYSLRDGALESTRASAARRTQASTVTLSGKVTEQAGCPWKRLASACNGSRSVRTDQSAARLPQQWSSATTVAPQASTIS